MPVFSGMSHILDSRFNVARFAAAPNGWGLLMLLSVYLYAQEMKMNFVYEVMLNIKFFCV